MSEFDEIEYDRDYPRESIRVKSKIMIDEQWHDCAIVNISPTGAKLHIERDLSRGMAVFIKIGEFGQFSATVAWCQGDEIGVKFDHDPLEMTRVLIELASRG
jgi:PilZ domain